MEKIKGLTLIELIVTTAIVSAVLLIALPDLTKTVERSVLRNKTTYIKTLIQLTRSSAIKHGGLAILCALNSKGTCTENWHKGITIFVDKNNNYKLDSDDILIRSEQVLQDTQSVKLKMSAHKNHIVYNSQGVTHGTFGSLYFCRRNSMLSYSQKLIINRSGRVRVEFDLDQDGKVDGLTKPSTSCI